MTKRVVSFDPARLRARETRDAEVARVALEFGEEFPFQPQPTDAELAGAAENLRAHRPAWFSARWRPPLFDPTRRAEKSRYLRHEAPDGSRSYPCLGVSKGEWSKTDWVIGRLVQNARLRAHKAYAPSVYHTWVGTAAARLAAVGSAMETASRLGATRVSAADMRVALYQYSTAARELSTFRPLRCSGLVRLLLAGDATATPVAADAYAGKRWLDPCAGWLDRLFAARAMGMDYLGFDPNPRLRGAADRLAAAPIGEGSQRVVTLPFEDAGDTIARDISDRGLFDLVLTSPPYFELEVYVDKSEEGGDTQSISRYPTFDKWVAGFFRPLLELSWRALKGGGRMCINITDSIGAPTATTMHRIVGEFPGAKSLGPVAFTGRNAQETAAVVHCWEKKIPPTGEISPGAPLGVSSAPAAKHPAPRKKT